MSAAEPKGLRLGADLVLYVSVPSHGLDLSSAEWLRLTERAVAVWRDSCTGCALPSIVVEKWKEKAPAPIREDGLSVVRLRSGDWCPDNAQDRAECYDPARRAITHLYPAVGSTDSALTLFREADIEINLVGLAQDVPQYSLGERALATLIHELGHVWGLSHSCPASLDVACWDAAARQSVMYPHATESGRALGLVPSTADIADLRAKYPSKQIGLDWSAVILGTVAALTVMGAVVFLRRRTHGRWRI